MLHEWLKTALNFFAAASALAAAISWWLAARQPVTKYIGTYLDVDEKMLEPLNQRVERGARLNASAATWAAVSAALQALVFFLQLAWPT